VSEVHKGAFPGEEHSFHSSTLRLLHAVEGERSEDLQVLGAPV
jgi:hypothetical protein